MERFALIITDADGEQDSLTLWCRDRHEAFRFGLEFCLDFRLHAVVSIDEVTAE